MSLDIRLTAMRMTPVFENNITHNLTAMAGAANLYVPVWRPEEMVGYSGGKMCAVDLVPILTEGLAALNADPAKFKALEPENGWGNYETLVRFVQHYLRACIENPDAIIEVSR